MRLIECPHNMVAGFPQSGLFKSEQAEAAMPFRTWPQKSHTVTSATFCSSEVSHQVQPFWREECQRVCKHIWKPSVLSLYIIFMYLCEYFLRIDFFELELPDQVIRRLLIWVIPVCVKTAYFPPVNIFSLLPLAMNLLSFSWAQLENGFPRLPCCMGTGN